MYNINDTILYGQQGVCKISEITTKQIGKQKLKYYVLKPVYNDKSTIFVPINNEKLVGKMRKILSKSEVYQLIDKIANEKTIWIEDDNLRCLEYKKIISSGNSLELGKLIKTIYLYKQQQKQIGKKLHMSDEQLFKEAEQILYDEFASALDIQRDQVLPLIIEYIESINT